MHADENPSPAVTIDALRNWSIVVSEDAAACQHYAAEEFQRFYQQATGVLLPLKQTTTGRTGHVFIGPGDALKESALGRLMQKEYAQEELRIVVAKGNIAILGGPRGTLYGVYAFLEDYLGIRFLTSDVTHVPTVSSQHVIPLTDRSYKPPFTYRFYLKAEVMEDPIFAVRRRQNAASPHGPQEQRLRARLGGEATGGVFLHNNFQLSASFEEHPEYYAFRDGKRSKAQPCLTHPEVRRIVTNQILGNLDGYPRGATLALAQNDNDHCCLCRRCAAVQREGDKVEALQMPKNPAGHLPENLRHGPPSAVVVDFVNHVADAVAPHRPDLWIGTEAYSYSVMPPRKTKVRANVKVQVATYHCSIVYPLEDPRSLTNQQFMDYLGGWRKACDNLLIWTYDMNPRDYWLPFPNMRSQPANLRSFVENNGRGVFMQGAPGGTEFSELRAYVMTALLWDPSRDADELINEFLALYYGRTARLLRQWINLLHDQAEASGSESNINATAKDYGLDAALGARGLDLFERALQAADNETIRLRVEKLSMTALRLALERVWWNVTEAPRQARVRKTTIQEVRIPIDGEDLPRYRVLARQLFTLAKKHNLGPRESARAAVYSYLGLPPENEKK